MNFGRQLFTFTVPKPWKNACLARIRFYKRVFILVAPHLLAVAVLIIYLLFGSYMFCTIEGWDIDSTSALKGVYNVSALETELRNGTADLVPHNDANATSDVIARVKRSGEVPSDKYRRTKKNSDRTLGWNVFDGVLFAYSTVTTIGYNDLTPTTDEGRLFYILYAMIGVPICAVVLVDWALFVEEFSHYLCRATVFGRRLFRYDTRQYSAIGAELIMMLPLAVVFFLLYVFLGALLLRLWECGWTFADGFYAAFDAVTTIGIGDIRPANHHYYPLTLIYVTVGIAISSTCLTLVVSDLARTIHYAGRPVTDCASKTLYLGSRRVRVCQLLDVVASEWGVEDAKLRELIGSRLDVLLHEMFRTSQSERKTGAVRTCRNNVAESRL